MSTIATLSLRNHTRDLAVKYALYEYIEYFKDDPEMLSIVTGDIAPVCATECTIGCSAECSTGCSCGTTTTTSTTSIPGNTCIRSKEQATNADLLPFFTPTLANREFATPLAIKVNNIMAELGDAAAEEIPKTKKNQYKKNPFVKIPQCGSQGDPQCGSQGDPQVETFKLNPSLTFYSILCTALDVENAEKGKKDRGSLGLYVSTVWDGKKTHGANFKTLNNFIATPLLQDYQGILTEYGFAIDTNGTVYDEDGAVREAYICGADRAHCEVNFNKEIFEKISPDYYFEEQTSLLQRKLIILPALRLLEQHKRGDLVHAENPNVASGDASTSATPKASRFEMAKDAFRQAFLSIATPSFEKTEGVLEMICYIEEKLKE